MEREAGVKYTKPALTFEQQADQLINRGLRADKEQLVKRLEATRGKFFFPLNC